MKSLSKNYLSILLSFFCFCNSLSSVGLFSDLLNQYGARIAGSISLDLNELKYCTISDQFSKISVGLRNKYDFMQKRFNIRIVGDIVLPAGLILNYKLIDPEGSNAASLAFKAAFGYVLTQMSVESKEADHVSFKDLLDTAGKEMTRMFLNSFGSHFRNDFDWKKQFENDPDFGLKVLFVFFIFLPKFLPEKYSTQSVPRPIIRGKDSSDDESVGPSRSSRGVSPASTPGTPYSAPGTTPPGLRLSDSAFGTPEKKK